MLKSLFNLFGSSVNKANVLLALTGKAADKALADKAQMLIRARNEARLVPLSIEPKLNQASKEILSKMLIRDNWKIPGLKLEFLNFAKRFIEEHGVVNLQKVLKDKASEARIKFVLQQLNNANVLIPALRIFLTDQAIKLADKTVTPMSANIDDYLILIQAQHAKGLLKDDIDKKNLQRREFLLTCRDLIEETPGGDAEVNNNYLRRHLTMWKRNEIFTSKEIISRKKPSHIRQDLYGVLSREGLHCRHHFVLYEFETDRLKRELEKLLDNDVLVDEILATVKLPATIHQNLSRLLNSRGIIEESNDEE